MRNILLSSLVLAGVAVPFRDGFATAQTGRGEPQVVQPPKRAVTAPAPARAPAPPPPTKIEANLLQVMRGIVYPSSNVVFAAQDDLAKFAPAADPSTSPNLLTSTYGGWPAVENAALALAESANLIVLPGRTCANGRAVPVRRPDWIKYVQGLRAAGVSAYKAAQSKNTDAMVEAAGAVAEACSTCHDVYREKQGPKDRCLP